MGPPNERAAAPGTTPETAADAQIAAPTKAQHQQDATAVPVVTITERRVTADVVVPDARAAVLLRRVVPGRGRETRDALRFLVFGSHLARLRSELQAAGYTVEVAQ